MTEIELAQKVLSNIEEESFDCFIYASQGGKCCDGWGDTIPFDLTAPQLRYLIANRSNDSRLMDSLEVEEISIEEKIIDLAIAGAWPDGGPMPSVENVIPKELEELNSKLEDLDEDDLESILEMREELEQVEDGSYTFTFSIVDGSKCYTFAEEVELEIELTKQEALGLLYGENPIDTVFEGICDTPLDDDLVNAKADAMNIADDYDNFSYGGNCETLEAYLDAWDYIISHILIGEITEEKVESWLEYFKDSSNYEIEIDDWMNDR